jgi:pilus assembly protein FimV
VYKSSFRACLLVLVLMSPWAVIAAGLGKLTINSALGQPLQAEIDLVAVRNEEISSLAAQLGSHEAFSQAGIDYKSFFSKLKISIEPRSNGDPFIKITSPNAINEPFLNMLIELSWASGRLMREYTVLLDPIESIVHEPVAPIINNNSVAVDAQSKKQKASVAPVKQVTKQKVTEAAPVSNNQRGVSYGPVNQGDTLSEIARQVSPQGVSLNQVLIAVFRANRDAFIEDNINLLKVGVVLRIPEQGEIAAISESEANQEVKVQVADWRSYRNRLVTAASESSTNEALKQSDTGQITTTMADEAVESNEPPKEVLRLSSGAPVDDISGADGNENEMPQDRLRMMEEDATARNLALNEANERIAILEKNIQDLQRLLELKDPTLAEAQVQAENLLSPESATPESMVEQDPELMHDLDSMLESESIAVMSDSTELYSDIEQDTAISQDAIVKTGAAEPFVPSDELNPSEEISLMDQLMKNITYIGGAVAFLLLGTLAIVRLRRKKAEDDLEADEMGMDASLALRERMASVKAADSLVSHEVDAARIDPDNAVTDDTLDTEQTSEDLHQENLEAFADEDSDEMAAHIETNPEANSQHDFEDPSDHSVERDEEVNIDLGDATDNSGQAVNSEQSDDVEFSLDLDEPASDKDLKVTDQEESELDLNIDDEPLLEKPEVTDPAINESDDMFKLDIPEPADNQAPDEREDQVEVETVAFESNNDITFDLDTQAEDASSEPVNLDESVSAEPVTSGESASAEQNEALDLGIDFPDVHENTMQAETGDTDEVVPDAELSEKQDEALDLDLNLDSNSDTLSADSNLLSSDSSLSDLKSEMNIPAPVSDEVAEPVDTPLSDEKDSHWHEVETKVDLARAYLDMEDKEGAREILEEVINEGDAQQKENAKAMLSEL